jgi:AbrB family looped-hinge helix DNA binding protein
MTPTTNTVEKVEEQEATQMDIATVSPGYKVYIPRHVREALGLHPGEQVAVRQDGDQIRVVPLREQKSR